MENNDIDVIDYNEKEFHEYHFTHIEECFSFRDNDHVTWINLSSKDKKTVHDICQHYKIHFLFEEDILSDGQRAKVDEQDDIVFCLVYMLRINKTTQLTEKEQISIILGKNFVITFQEEPEEDAFHNIRTGLKSAASRIRLKGADFLLYSMLDAIVDDYQVLIDHFGDKIEEQEDDLILNKEINYSIMNIAQLRKDLMMLRRNIFPVREIVNSFLKTDNPLIDTRTERYFKDIYDHILQSQDIIESYHDSMSNLHDLYLNKQSLKMNESMNIMAIVTCLLAPATVIGGIFGMNFDKIPFLHDADSFYVIIVFLAIVFILMLGYFKKKKWL